jgi:ABC-2 type transport system ATP-binding protein
MNAIEIKKLHKIFRDKRLRKVQALSDLSLDIKMGEVFGFLGPNGAGKSTTIKCLMGLIRPTSGNAYICGESVASPKARRHVGYLPENPAFYDYLNAIEYLHFTGRTHGMSGRRLEEEIERVLHLMEIWDARKRPLRTFSKGMVQRLGLAQAILHDPDVYILDEPMSGLDPLGRALVKTIIQDLKSRGKTVFFSTHISSDVETVCDRLGIINKGQFQIVERVETILSRGLKGYVVKTRDPEIGTVEDRFVDVDELDDYLDNVRARGLKLDLVEPHRKHLEDFFLSIVNSEET